jgi:hypothetical protein
VITLAPNEERLVEALRALPPNLSDHVVAWITSLHDLGEGKTIEWSDEWSEEDLADVSRASLATFEDREQREV